MSMYINPTIKIKNIYVKLNAQKKNIVSAWVNRDGVPAKVFGTNNDKTDEYAVAPANANLNWNYTLDDESNTITLYRYIGSETDVIVYGNYLVGGKTYKTQLANNDALSYNYMFAGKKIIESIIFNNTIDTSNITSMKAMFYNCTSLSSLNLSSFDTSNVTNMDAMFAFCMSLIELDLSSFNTKNVTSMFSMFESCEALSNLNISSFDTSNVTDMKTMFYSCRSLIDLNLSSFDTSNVTNMINMFGYSLQLKYIYVTKYKWITSQARTDGMFDNCGVSSVTYK